MKATGEEDPQVATFAVAVDELVKEILANATVRTKLGLILMASLRKCKLGWSGDIT